jgi:hypothetical protein
MRRLGATCALVFTAACLWGATTASAVPVSATLTSSNGHGSFDDTIGCPAGDGQSWSYQYTGLSNPLTGPLGGEWNGTIEVHRGVTGDGFMPAGTGRIGIDNTGRGAVFFEFSGGDCSANPLNLSGLGDEPVVSGTLPLHVTGGTGAYRLITGSGTASMAAALSKGADNPATINLNADLAVLQPNITVGQATAKWPRVADWLGRNIAVFVTVTNSGPSSTTGDAYDVQLVSATVAGAGPTGLPPKIDHIAPGGSNGVGFSVSNVNAGGTYTATLTFAVKDALGASLPPLVVQRTFKAPLTPLNII